MNHFTAHHNLAGTGCRVDHLHDKVAEHNVTVLGYFVWFSYTPRFFVTFCQLPVQATKGKVKILK